MSISYKIGGPDATIQNSYWLGTNLEDTTCKDTEFMKTQDFVDLLNSEDDKIFLKDATGINKGYPILSWQKEIQTEWNNRNIRKSCNSSDGLRDFYFFVQF